MRGRSPLLPFPGTMAVAAVLGLLLGACGWSEDDSASTSVPVVDPVGREAVAAEDLGPFGLPTGGMAGPGTPLGGGLSVPEGAVLLGVPFPDLTGGGYRALLLVTGDPVVVFDAVATQAGGLGMDRRGGCLGTFEGMGCTGRFVDAADGESLEVEARRGTSIGGVESGMALRYRPPGSDEVADAPSALPGPTAPLPTVDLPPMVEAPPDDDVGRAVRDLSAPARAVEVGSTLVGLPGPCACDGQRGWSFVVQVDGMVRDLIAAYARQFTDLGDPPDVSDRYQDGLTVLGLRVGEGTEVAEIRAVDPDASTSYLIVTVVEG